MLKSEFGAVGAGARTDGRACTRVLIIHQNFPGQFRHVASRLRACANIEVIGLGRDTAPGLPGFPWFKYRLHRRVRTDAHAYLRQMEDAVLHGQAVARALLALKRRGFVPDVVLAHPGWGETLYLKEVFPAARLVHYCEWYYGTHGADFGFDPEFPPSADDRLRITTWNALHLLNLQNCDAAISPTHWQRNQHPEVFRSKIRVIHEGVDTCGLNPEPTAKLSLAGLATGIFSESESGTLTVAAGDPIVTYVARNLEPYRGFHTFMRALPKVLGEHPHARILVVGGDGKSYGRLPTDAPNWREKMLQEVGEDLRSNLHRIHFLGKVPYNTYKKILQVSAAHVYLTYPFVLSWSLLEAMATGCPIIASDTTPVREVMRDGEQGALTDFFDPAALANKILHFLRNPACNEECRRAAREKIQKSYSQVNGTLRYLGALGLSNVGSLA